MRAFPIALVLLLASCHGPARPGSIPERRVGEFAFRVRISTLDPIDGVIAIARDTVTVEADGQTCRRTPGVAGPLYLHPFSCFPPGGINTFALTVDSDRPAQSSWTAVQTIQRSRERCVRFVTNARGTQVCAETRQETYFEDVRHGGRLLITAVDTTKRP
jgi:hypothetical protein